MNENESKKQLEIEKLKIQIHNEKKSIFRKVSFYSSMVPIILSITALIYSISTGFFENESKLLEIKKENLKDGIREFQIQKDSVKKVIDRLQIEKDSLSQNFDSIFKLNQLFLVKIKINEKKLESVSKNLNRLYKQDYIYRIESVAQNKMDSSENNEKEAKRWISNYKDEKYKFIKDCIRSCFGLGNGYVINAIPDSISISLEKQSLKLLDNNYYLIFSKYDKSLMKAHFEDVTRLKAECDPEKVQLNLSNLSLEIDTLSDKEKKYELLDDWHNLQLETQDCISRLRTSYIWLRNDIRFVKIKIMNEFISLLQRSLK